MTPPALLLPQVVERLQQARQRVASGVPSVELALAGNPVSTATLRLAAAKGAGPDSEPWVRLLADAMALVTEARLLWGSTPDQMPPLTQDLAPCGMDLRLWLSMTRVVAEKCTIWEDAGDLTRAQALCVLHLAVCLAQWRAIETRAELAAAKAQAEVDRGREERATTAARVIWGPEPGPEREPRDVGPRSLRDLASISAAFSQWADDESPE
jgi:hypothetical protein